MWYTRDEQALVIGSFYSMNGFQQCVGGLIAYGIYHIQDAALKNWQILFTVCNPQPVFCLSVIHWEVVASWMHHGRLGLLCPVVAARLSYARPMLLARGSVAYG